MTLIKARFSDIHGFERPNDVRALCLMNRAAQSVMEELRDVVLAFGESDEYRSAQLSRLRKVLNRVSFLIRRSSNLYNRRRA